MLTTTQHPTLDKEVTLSGNILRLPTLIAAITLITACGGGGSSDSSDDVSADNSATTEDSNNDTVTLTAADESLSVIIADRNLSGNPTENRDLPDITEDLPQLGMKLFFSKSLGGAMDSACVSCHHPALGGDDDLSLSVGVAALNPDQLGEGRQNADGIPVVPRNAPTVFNVALWDVSLFFDSRVESQGKEIDTNGALSGISTPDSGFGITDANAGANLTAAQARFPVTSAEEMKTDDFEVGSDNDTVRDHLAARIGNYGVGAGELTTNDWLTEFQTAFGSTADAETLITFDNIAQAIGEYERSLVFVNNPWNNYLNGDLDAISEEQKEGAILFFTSVDQGGAGCAACHNGDLFSDQSHNTVAFPQFGPGKGNPNNDDFARENVTGDSEDRYKFRTPSLLNIAETAPYGHTGAYETLSQVVRHYTNPRGRVDDFFDDGGWCQLEQFDNLADCAALYPNAESNSNLALTKLDAERQAGTSRFPQNARLNNNEVNQLVAFLEALTDPCINDRSCISPWIPDTDNTGPDGNQLNAVDQNNNLL